MRQALKIRIGLFSALAAAVFFLSWQALSPSGRACYRQDFAGRSYFIGRLTPETRVASMPGAARITGDPAYYRLRTFRRFDQALVTYRFRTNRADAVVETGPLSDPALWRYQLKPVYNQTIDRLAGANSVREDGVLFWQKDARYGSLAEFLSDPPPNSEIALYHFDWPHPFFLPGYASSSPGQTIGRPLRGPYQLYTYIKDEELDLRFEFSDLNQNQDKDPIELILSYQGAVIDTRKLGEGEGAEDNAPRARGGAGFLVPGLPEGLYKVEMKASDDIVTARIESGQAKLSFISKLELLRDRGGGLELYTDSSEIQAATPYPDRLQTISVGPDRLAVAETYRQFRAAAAGGLSAVALENDGISLSGDGTWAFSPGAWLNPAFKKASGGMAGVNYVVAAYEEPARDGEWLVASQSFDLRSAYRENGAYEFVISVPGLRADDGSEDWLEIGAIEVELSGRSLYDKIFRGRNSP